MRYAAILISILFLSFVAFSGCNTTKHTPSTYADKQIVVGEGGGATGNVNKYYILESGEVFQKKSGDEKPQRVDDVSSKCISNIFEEYEGLDFTAINFDHPGNRYHFVEFKEQGEKHRVTWGSNDHEVPKKVKEFYKYVMDIIKELKSSSKK